MTTQSGESSDGQHGDELDDRAKRLEDSQGVTDAGAGPFSEEQYADEGMDAAKRANVQSPLEATEGACDNAELAPLGLLRPCGSLTAVPDTASSAALSALSAAAQSSSSGVFTDRQPAAEVLKELGHVLETLRTGSRSSARGV